MAKDSYPQLQKRLAKQKRAIRYAVREMGRLREEVATLKLAVKTGRALLLRSRLRVRPFVFGA